MPLKTLFFVFSGAILRLVIGRLPPLFGFPALGPNKNPSTKGRVVRGATLVAADGRSLAAPLPDTERLLSMSGGF